MRKLMMLLCMVMAVVQLYAQSRTITGKVTDNSGNPISNATIKVKGSTIGTTSDNSGNFRLTVPPTAKALVISYIGFGEQEVAIGAQTSYNVSLTATSGSLDEVVVQVPYGTVKKTAFTGSEATITAKAIEKQQVTSVTRAIEGLVPGVIATNGGGQPGSNASVLIRGVGSINATSSPLYVVNGVPYDGSISALNSDEIESLTVLKDAAAAALYGSRAANGVIMITTKKGKRGRPAVNAIVRQGFMTRGIPEYDRLGAKEYYELTWETIRNTYVYSIGQSFTQAGQTASNLLTTPNGLGYNAYNVAGNQLVDPTTGKLNSNAQLLWNDSWEDALFRTASRQNASLNISGAGDRSDYFFGFGYLNEEGIMNFTGYKRYNMRLNVNTAATNWLNTGLNIDGSLANQTNVTSSGSFTSNPFYYTRNIGPIYPVYQRYQFGSTIGTPGAYILDATGNRQLDWGRAEQMGGRPFAPNSNLLGSLELDEQSSQVINANANTYAEIKFSKELSFKTTVGLNIWDNSSTTFQNSLFGDAESVKGRSTKGATRQFSLTINEVLTWNKTIGKHGIRALLGHENYSYKENRMSSTKTGFAFAGSTELANAAVEEGSSSSEDNNRIESYFASANYDFDARYLLSGSIRRDASSRFAPENRWGTFYSAGLGWRISQEKFLKNVNWLNELKIRASYGQQGNEDIGRYYVYQSLYDLGWNNAQSSGALIGAPANRDLKWEVNTNFNVGIDFAVFKNRLQGTIDYFERKSSQLIFSVPVIPSTITGSTIVPMNVGNMTNKGIEIQLGYNAIRGKNFDWRIDVNLTHFKNRITEMPPSQQEIVSGTKKLSVGNSVYEFWLKEFAGVDPATGNSLYYRDVLDASNKPTGERTLTDDQTKASFYYMGSALPKLTGGVTNSFRYKQVELSFLLTFAYGGKFYDGNYQGLMGRSSLDGNAWHTDILNRWQKPGDITNVPKLQEGIASTNEATSSRFLFDGSFLNVKNITLSYTLPKVTASRLRMAGLQFFMSVDNAYVFTAKKGIDPQRSFNGTSDFSYPPYRTMTIGLNVTL